MEVYPDQKVLKVLRQLGYSKFKIKYRKIHAKRGQDHILIKLNRNGMPRTDKPNLISAHQDIDTENPPYHRADYKQEKKLVKEFIRAWIQEIKESSGP
ncbi:MAG TPA: hypothetical protein ENN36_00055 [Candidatus Bathyarchaeota archaeon]|mgnify:CR=1 FL=1|nr:hypothetical protein [Candidatus Bathyarchaeota archaeon]